MSYITLVFLFLIITAVWVVFNLFKSEWRFSIFTIHLVTFINAILYSSVFFVLVRSKIFEFKASMISGIYFLAVPIETFFIGLAYACIGVVMVLKFYKTIPKTKIELETWVAFFLAILSFGLGFYFFEFIFFSLPALLITTILCLHLLRFQKIRLSLLVAPWLFTTLSIWLVHFVLNFAIETPILNYSKLYLLDLNLLGSPIELFLYSFLISLSSAMGLGTFRLIVVRFRKKKQPMAYEPTSSVSEVSLEE